MRLRPCALQVRRPLMSKSGGEPHACGWNTRQGPEHHNGPVVTQGQGRRGTRLQVYSVA